MGTLESMTCNVDDKELSLAALNGLPSNFEHVIVPLVALGNDDKLFSFGFMENRLLHEELRSEDPEGKSVKSMETSGHMSRVSITSKNTSVTQVCVPEIVVEGKNIIVPTVVVMEIQPVVVGSRSERSPTTTSCSFSSEWLGKCKT